MNVRRKPELPLQAHLLREKAVIKSLATGSSLQKGKIARISMLGADELQWTQDNEGLHITTPAQKPGDDAFSFRRPHSHLAR